MPCGLSRDEARVSMRARNVTVALCSTVVVTLSVFGLVSSEARLAAQGPASYTEAQSTRGAEVSSKNCNVCHGEELKGSDLAPSLQGAEFVNAWAGKTMADLFEKIDTTMPANSPGSLKKEEVADVLAYILKLNHAAAGAELSKDPAVLKTQPFAPGK